MRDNYNGNDCNVFTSGADDILTSVNNKTFTVVKGTCPVPAQAAADLSTILPQSHSTADLGNTLKEITSKNEGISLSTTWLYWLSSNYIFVG